MKNLETFYVEVTDTFGGEANYCWVHRFKVLAKSMQGAIGKVSREMGLHFRQDYDCGDHARYNSPGNCICAFAEWFDPESHQYHTLTDL